MKKKILFCWVALLSSGIAHAELAKENGWKTEAEAGVVATTGNTESNSVNVKDKTSFGWELNIIRFRGSYLHTSNFGVEQALYWSLGLRYERELSDRFSVFAGEFIEGDRYKNILQRYSTDLGGKYYFDKQKQFIWFTETGFRLTRENYPYGFKNFNFLRLYNELERFFTANFSVKWWIEYLPNLTVWRAYQFNTDLSLISQLSDIFSLKAGYQLRYYNEPPIGIVHNTDTIFTTALVANF